VAVPFVLEQLGRAELREVGGGGDEVAVQERGFDRGQRGRDALLDAEVHDGLISFACTTPAPYALAPMAKISDILRRGLSFSFEFFPPRTPEMEETLRTTLVELETLAPSYVSVTYGAGGTTRERTHDIVVDILSTTTMTAMAHLTCAAHTRAELVEIVTRYRDAGIENVLCLGGDPPACLHPALDHAHGRAPRLRVPEVARRQAVRRR